MSRTSDQPETSDATTPDAETTDSEALDADVVHLRIADGGDHLTRLHRICADLLPSASPFDYHPHLTLAHGLDEEGLHRARWDFASCRLSFRAEQLQIFHGDRTGWRDLGALPLGPAR